MPKKNRMSPSPFILEAVRQHGCRFMIRPELSRRRADHIAEPVPVKPSRISYDRADVRDQLRPALGTAYG